MTSPGSSPPRPLGAVLAGGAGRRLGGGKPLVRLAGRPLISWACDALRPAVDELVVVAKPDTRLPPLPDTVVWREPPEPRHPLFGLVWTLEHAGGRPVLVCAADLPLAGTELLARLAAAATEGAVACVAAAADRIQPLLGCYAAAALDPLRRALAADPGVPLTRAVHGLGPIRVEADPAVLLNVNTPGDLRRAEARLAGER